MLFRHTPSIRICLSINPIFDYFSVLGFDFRQKNLENFEAVSNRFKRNLKEIGMLGLNDFREAVRNPNEYARRMKTEGKKIIGYFCSYTPEELILAAGFHPFRLFGGKSEISLADAHLQSYCCSLVRSGLEEALAGRLDFLDGTVFPHTCDSIQRLSDIWRLNTDFGFFADVVLPVKLDTDSAREYMIDVLGRFRSDLERFREKPIEEAELRVAFEQYNQIRKGLKDIYLLHAENPELLGGGDLYALIKGAMIMDRAALARSLPGLYEEIKSGRHAREIQNRKRILLVGGVCDQPEIYDLIEATGGVVVWDDLCTGSRWFEGEIDPAVPLEGLAERYTSRPLCPSKHFSVTLRGETTVDLARKFQADGVLFLLLKFCDPHAFDYPYMKQHLDQAGIPSLLYEVEDQLPSEGQIRTRLETFIEMM